MTPSTLAFAAGDDGDDETIVANGDEIFLQRAVFVMGSEETFEGFLNQVALLFAFAAEAAEGDAGIVGQRAVGRILPRRSLDDFAEVGDADACAARRGNFSDGGEEDAAASAARSSRRVSSKISGRVQSRAFDAEVREGGTELGYIVEADLDALRC